MAVVAGLMSKTIQYTYGVIGAAESSTTSAKLLVPAGTPAQSSGGLTGLPPAQVYRGGIAFCRNAPLLTVITLGVASVMPDPHPAIDRAQPTATTAAATRRMRRARGALPPDPGPCRPRVHLRCPILGPDASRADRVRAPARLTQSPM